MKRRRRGIAILLALTVFFGMFQQIAFAAENGSEPSAAVSTAEADAGQEIEKGSESTEPAVVSGQNDENLQGEQENILSEQPDEDSGQMDTESEMMPAEEWQEDSGQDETLTASENDLDEADSAAEPQDDAENEISNPVTVYVSISKAGQFVKGKDNKSVAEVPVQLDGKESYTIDDALKAAHEQCGSFSETKGYESYEGQYGLAIKTLWGVSGEMFGYQVNRGTVTILGLSHVISDGDYIDAYINQSEWPDNEAYAVFSKSTYRIAAGAELSLKLTQAGYDEDRNTVFENCEGATITVDGAETNATTNEKGSATISISEVGTHVVSAVKTKKVGGKDVTAITAPVCVVTVTEVPRLKSLTISNKDKSSVYKLDPAFNSNVTEYSIDLPDYTSTVYAYPELAEGTDGKGMSYYGYNSMFGNHGWSSSNSIATSGGYFGVVIYDKANSMSVEDIRYTVNIKKHATLKALSVDGVETQEFNRDRNDGYCYYVDDTADGVDITADAYKNSYTLTIGGKEAVSGEKYHLSYQWSDKGEMEVPVTVSGSNLEPYTYSLLLKKKPLEDKPFIMIQPTGADYIIKESSAAKSPAALTVSASANGALSYQWYKKTEESATEGTVITGATEASFTPPTEEVGTVFYYCVVTNKDKQENNTAVSDSCRIIVDPDPVPKATITNPGNANPDGSIEKYKWGYVYNVGAQATPLTVEAESDAKGEDDTWTYTWRSVTRPYNISGWSSLTGVTNTASYTPATTLNLANSTGKYYACEVSHTFKGTTYKSWATTGKTYTDGEGDNAKTYDVCGVYVFITVTEAAKPEITKQPVSADYVAGDRMANLIVSATKADGGTLSYQWYKNDKESNEGGTLIEGAASSYYTLGTAEEGGTNYYYCVVTNTIQDHTSESVSEAARIKIKTAEEIIADKLEGTGTEQDPYLIKDAKGYQDIADIVAQGVSFKGMYFRQSADITLPDKWEPVGIAKNKLPFSGKLDCDNHTVTVPEGGLPLFGYVVDAEIKNLNIFGKKIAGYGLVNNLEGVGLSGNAVTFDNITLKSGSSTLKSGLIGTYITTNGFAGCSAGYDVTIRNCTVEEGVTIGYDKDESMIGSFAGRVNGTIENCVSHADVYGKDYAGGILGTRDNALGMCYIKDCTFDGTVEASGEHAGGIVGGGYSNSSGTNGAKVNIEGCSSGAKVTGADKVGGIVGGDTNVVQLWGGHTLRNNSFTGTVTATSGTYAGGIIGYYASLNKYDNIVGNYYSSDCGAKGGIGFVQYVDTSCKEHESESGATYVNTAEGDAGVPGMTKTDLNRTDDPLGADASKLFYNDSTPVTPIELVISGSCKNEYKKGEDLDLSGIILTVSYTNGTSKTISVEDVEVIGFDKNKIGRQEITLNYNGLTAALSVLVLNAEGEITVNVSILGDTLHNCEADGKIHTLTDGNLDVWVPEKDYTVGSNDTVVDVLNRIFGENGITASNPSGSYFESLTKDGVTIGELTNGKNSGWMFTLNGVHVDKSVSEQYLENGDKIVFHYTDDYEKDKDSVGGVTAEDVTALIDALPDVDKLTLNDEAAVAKAGDTFNSLSDEERAKVPEEKQEKLNAALLKIAELKKAQADSMEDIYKAAGNYLAGVLKGNETFGMEWSVIGLARADRTADINQDAYYANVVDMLKKNGSAKLSGTKSTENSRLVLALTAIGRDVTDVAGYNLLAPLADLGYLKEQGINGPIWALIAFDCHGYEIPAAAGGGVQATRENLIQTILDARLSDGGWALSGTVSDPDITAMSLQTLAPYYGSNAQVRAAVDGAIDRLSTLQNADGSYSSWDTTNAESCVQVIVALTALGINPATDSRFVKNGNSVLDALLAFHVTGSGFKHVSGGEVNGMASEQGYYALTAYFRMKNGQTRLYDMSDVEIRKNTEDSHTEHNCKTEVVKATTAKNGSIINKCTICGEIISSTTIYYPRTISLSKTAYTCDGKGKKPSVTVKGSDGKLISPENYTVSYAGGCKNVGQYKVTVSFKGNYSGSVTKTFKINPKGTAISKVSGGKKSITVKWKKQSSQTDGYQIQYSTKKNFKSGAKIVPVNKKKAKSKKISKLKAKKKYYVRVRTYKTVKINGKSTKLYSAWSKVKTVKTKK